MIADLLLILVCAILGGMLPAVLPRVASKYRAVRRERRGDESDLLPTRANIERARLLEEAHRELDEIDVVVLVRRAGEQQARDERRRVMRAKGARRYVDDCVSRWGTDPEDLRQSLLTRLDDARRREYSLLPEAGPIRDEVPVEEMRISDFREMRRARDQVQSLEYQLQALQEKLDLQAITGRTDRAC